MANSINKVVTYITLHTDEFGNYNPIYIYAKQGDNNSRFLTATILGKGGKINITGTSRINVTDDEGYSSYAKGETNEDGTVTVPLTSAMLSKSGKLECDISVFGTDDEDSILTTATFYVIVDESHYTSEAYESYNGPLVPAVGGEYGGIYVGDGDMPDGCVLQIDPYVDFDTVLFDCGTASDVINDLDVDEQGGKYE